MRLNTLVATMLCGILIGIDARVGTATAQTTCPVEAERTRNNVVRFLTGDRWASNRQDYGMSGLAASSVVLLTDASDAAVCQRLRGMVGQPQNARYPQVFSYYKAGAFYFVAFTWVVPGGRIWTAFSPLVIVRSDFSYLDTFAM